MKMIHASVLHHLVRSSKIPFPANQKPKIIRNQLTYVYKQLRSLKGQDNVT